MKLIVDAQLPLRLTRLLVDEGCDARHTRQLPRGNRTPDGELCAVADAEDRIVVTKDDDFVVSHLLQGTPRRLLLVATGNIANDELCTIFQANIDALGAAFAIGTFVELSRTSIVVRR